MGHFHLLCHVVLKWPICPRPMLTLRTSWWSNRNAVILHREWLQIYWQQDSAQLMRGQNYYVLLCPAHFTVRNTKPWRLLQMPKLSNDISREMGVNLNIAELCRMNALKLIAKHSENVVSVLLKIINLSEKGKHRSKKETHWRKTIATGNLDEVLGFSVCSVPIPELSIRLYLQKTFKSAPVFMAKIWWAFSLYSTKLNSFGDE